MSEPLPVPDPPRMFGSSWSPDSWRARPASQQLDWPDAAALDAARADLRRQPPLVFDQQSPGVERSIEPFVRINGY